MPTVSSSGLSPPLLSDLSKLNVSQLKAICKERRIVGYSKLGKAALVRKLGELKPSPLAPSSAQSSQLLGQADAVIRWPGAVPPPPPLVPNPVSGSCLSQSYVTSVSISAPQLPPCLSGGRGKTPSPSISLNAPVPKPVSSEVSQHTAPLAKKRKIAAPLALATPHLANSEHLPGHSPPVSAFPGSALVPRIEEVGQRQSGDRTQTVAMPGKRFKPLTITRSPLATVGNRTEAQPPSCLPEDRSIGVKVQLWHLDFPARLECPLLTPITFPPLLSQRKRIESWSIILSGLSGKEMFQCCLVSKLIRYAVYSSAYYKLCREFSGRRLSLVLQQCGSVLMMNFWPYLRLREQEVSERKNAIMSSFFQSLFRSPSDIISARLWSSPEDEKQLTVALRFLLTRLWFALSAGTECGRSIRTDWLHDTITDVVEIVKGEIWRVTTRNAVSGYVQVFHVLEATCEVLGLAGGTHGDEHLRSDWARYIEQRKANSSSTSPLCDSMRWADHAEFDRGISRHWLRRTAQMGAQGAVLRTIAERYTLACVVGNSLSGRWMSAPEMAQEFAGLVQRRPLPLPTKASNANLFLPAHHHVESVHLTAAGGRPLHPALAVVQTTAREYYILRDNGLEVGCEEEGVASVWMRVLGCDARGEPIARVGVSFEELKAYIQNL